MQKPIGIMDVLEAYHYVKYQDEMYEALKPMMERWLKEWLAERKYQAMVDSGNDIPD